MSDRDPSDITAFVTQESPGERMQLDGCDVHVVHHDPGTSREDHTHEETHIVFIRSGTMRWGVGDDEQETGSGETIVTPEGVPHSWEVLGDEPARVVCVTAPPEADSNPGLVE